VKLVVEYVANAVKFERLATLEERPEFKAVLEKQAAAYRKLAKERAQKMGLQPPESN
jgi:hypothetical protein